MANPYNPPRRRGGRSDRASRLAARETLARTRALDRGGLMGRHLESPENVGDSVRNAAKFLEHADVLEESADTHLIPRRSQGVKQHLKIYPTFAETRTETVRRLARCRCGHLAHEKKCTERHPNGRMCQCRRKLSEVLADGMIVRDGQAMLAVTTHNTRAVAPPERSLLKQGIPFAKITDRPTRGSSFAWVNPYTKQIDRTSPDAVETMPSFETVKTYPHANAIRADYIDFYAPDPIEPPPDTLAIPTKRQAVATRPELADKTRPIVRVSVGPSCKHGLFSCSICSNLVRR